MTFHPTIIALSSDGLRCVGDSSYIIISSLVVGWSPVVVVVSLFSLFFELPLGRGGGSAGEYIPRGVPANSCPLNQAFSTSSSNVPSTPINLLFNSG